MNFKKKLTRTSYMLRHLSYYSYSSYTIVSSIWHNGLGYLIALQITARMSKLRTKNLSLEKNLARGSTSLSNELELLNTILKEFYDFHK